MPSGAMSFRLNTTLPSSLLDDAQNDACGAPVTSVATGSGAMVQVSTCFSTLFRHL
jgi:hypothetical protein